MAITVIEDAVAASSFSSDTAPGNTQQSISRPASAIDGTYVTVEFNVAPPGTALTATMSTVPTGWTLITSGVKTGSPTTQGFVYGKFMQAGDTGPWVWGYSLPSNVVSQIHVHSGVDTVTPFVETGWLAQASSNTSRIVPTLTLAAPRFVRYGTHDRNASDPVVPAPDAATKLRNFQSASVSLVSAYAGLQTGTFNRTFTGAATTSVAGSFAYALNPAIEVTVALGGTGTFGAVGTVPSGATADFSGAGSLSLSTNVAMSGSVSFSGTGSLSMHKTTAVDLYLAQSTMYAAHRGGSADWPEETLYSYAQAATWNKDLALEISMWQTLDGVWVASHDRTTGRVFSGTSYDIPTTNWTGVLENLVTINGAKPIAKVTDILDIYATGDRVIFVDDKNGQDETGFYAMLASYGGTGRFIIKAAGTATSWAPTASARGYQSWGYFYHSDYANVPTLQSNWTMLGMDVFTGDSSDWSRIKSYGKPVLAHIISTAAQKATAAAFSPDGYMAAGVTEVVPQTVVETLYSGSGQLSVFTAVFVQPAFTGAGTLSLQTVFGPAIAANFSGSGTFTSSEIPSLTEIVGYSGSGTFVASAQGDVAVSVNFSGTGIFSTESSVDIPVSVAFLGNGVLAVISESDIHAVAGFGGSGTLTVTSYTPVPVVTVFDIAESVWTGVMITRLEQFPERVLGDGFIQDSQWG